MPSIPELANDSDFMSELPPIRQKKTSTVSASKAPRMSQAAAPVRHATLPSIWRPRTDLPRSVPDLESERDAELTASHLQWVESNKPREWTVSEQKKSLCMVVAEAHHYHMERNSTALESKAEALRASRLPTPAIGRKDGSTRASNTKKQAGGISAMTAKMLLDDVNVIFQHYENPYAVGKQAFQTFGLWDVKSSE